MLLFIGVQTHGAQMLVWAKIARAPACRTGLQLSTPALVESSFAGDLGIGGAMRVKVLLQITDDDGTAAAAEEVAAFEKETERPEDLGLSIAEGKALTGRRPATTSSTLRSASWAERHRCCEACGHAPAQQGQPPASSSSRSMAM